MNLETKGKDNCGKQKGRFLIVDDESSSSLILVAMLESQGLRVETARNEQEMSKLLEMYSFDAVFLDYKLGSANGLKLIPKIIREHPYCRIIMITGHGSVDVAVDAFKKGVSGFITKPFDEDRVRYEIKKTLHNKNNSKTTAKIIDDSGIIGKSPQIIRLHEQINKMKDVESTVLILGESGTGKELVARALHKLSIRSNNRFEAVNCAAIPENILEAELFGCKKGAFTDAKADRKGLFEICNAGTLFLDEIGEMPLHLQSKLLRALQEKEVTPLGASKSIKIKTRIVAATNQNLEKLIQSGSFRKDLFYRLSVLQIALPPLKERKEDINLLASYFVERLSEQFDKKIRPLSEELQSRLRSYDWPGNIRELNNSLERAIVLSTNGQISLQDIFSHIEKNNDDEENQNFSEIKPLQEAKENYERKYLERLLKATHGNVSEASKVAGRLRTDMYRLFSKYNIDPQIFK